MTENREQTISDSPEWHSLDLTSVYTRLTADQQGLSTQEAAMRLQQFGENRIAGVRRQSVLMRFLSQFNNILIYVLLISCAITLLLQEWIDSGVILGVVLINAIVGFVQEGKAERALEAIQNYLPLNALVLRNGHFTSLPAQALVPGDIISLQPGDRVSADVRLIETRELLIDEATLTGESLPQSKSIEAVAAQLTLADQHCMGFSGTFVIAGQGKGIVVATGSASQLGHISTMLAQVQSLTTPLTRHMASFAKWLTLAIGVFAVLTYLIGTLVYQFEAREMFMASVGLMIAAVPEGLPAIITIALAVGVQRMARRNAIIRRLPAVETLGSVTVICTDKTGTLTHNEMMVQSVITVAHDYQVTGSGYEPQGQIFFENNKVDIAAAPALQQLLQAVVLCNEAVFRQSNQHDLLAQTAGAELHAPGKSSAPGWQIEGDPTEVALLVLAKKLGMEQAELKQQWPRQDVIPFDSEKRFMASLHRNPSGKTQIFVKGAPEKLLAMSHYQQNGEKLEPLDQDYWQQKFNTYASQGQRLLAAARIDVTDSMSTLHESDFNKQLVFIGVLGLIDPPRQEAADAIQLCRQAGITVKMITGDHALTASAIARQLGISASEKATVLSGQEIDQMDRSQLARQVTSTNVFARTSPEHKLLIVKALQDNHEVVAMTGDGVNDAPALQRADIGVAMGNKGTEVSKQAAEMVLADDNFTSIARAVEEGRIVYDNLRKSIVFVLPTSFGGAFTIMFAIMLGQALPITAVQILWVNMITTVTLALTLSFEPAEKNIMQRPPRDPGESILTRFILWRILFVSVIVLAGTYGNFIWEYSLSGDLDLARTMAVNTLVLFEVFYIFNTRFLYQSALHWQVISGNRIMLWAVLILIMFQLLYTYAPPMQLLFSSKALSLWHWLQIILVAFSIFVIVEIEKSVFRRNLLQAVKPAG